MAPRNLPNPQWPDINYDDVYRPLNNTSIDASMKNRVVNLGFIDADIFDNNTPNYIANNIDLENYIFELIESNDYQYHIERIFHLIEIWGGRAGRGLYQTRGNHIGFHWTNVEKKYNNIINACLSLKDNSDKDLAYLYEILSENRIEQIGVSYITKHVRFWTKKSLKDNMLPVYDNIMSRGNLGTTQGLYGVNANWTQMVYYWKDMQEKAKVEHISLKSLERLLFNYFR